MSSDMRFLSLGCVTLGPSTKRTTTTTTTATARRESTQSTASDTSASSTTVEPPTTPRLPTPEAEKEDSDSDTEPYTPCPHTDLPFTRPALHRTAPPPRSILRAPSTRQPTTPSTPDSGASTQDSTTPTSSSSGAPTRRITFSPSHPLPQPVQIYIRRLALSYPNTSISAAIHECNFEKIDFPERYIPPANRPSEESKERARVLRGLRRDRAGGERGKGGRIRCRTWNERVVLEEMKEEAEERRERKRMEEEQKRMDRQREVEEREREREEKRLEQRKRVWAGEEKVEEEFDVESLDRIEMV